MQASPVLNREPRRGAVSRALSLLLALLLALAAPLSAFAAPNPNAALAAGSGMPQALDITATAALYPDAFPEANSRLRDFARALEMLSLKGTLTYRDFYGKDERLFLDGDVMLNGRSAANLQLNGSHTYLRVTSNLLGERAQADAQTTAQTDAQTDAAQTDAQTDAQTAAPALVGSIVSGQRAYSLFMSNYYEFMFKPYFFLGLPTQYIALLTYPYGAFAAVSPIVESARAAFDADESRVFTAEEMTAFAEEVAAYASDNTLLRNFARALLLDAGGDELFLESLCALPDWVALLTEEGAELTLTVDGGTRTWALGGAPVYAETVSDDGSLRAAFTPPASLEGYLLRAEIAWTTGELGATLRFETAVTQEGEDVFHLTADADQLPCEGVTSLTGEQDGKLALTFGGRALSFCLPDGEGALALRYRWEKEKARAGKTKMWLRVSWDHPETGKEAARIRLDGLAYESKTDLAKRPRARTDFFGLNDASLIVLLKDIKKPLITGLVPFVAELPWGVVNTLFDFLDDSGILDMLGSSN